MFVVEIKKDKNPAWKTELTEKEFDEFIKDQYNHVIILSHCFDFSVKKQRYGSSLRFANYLYKVPFKLIEKKMKTGNKKCWNFYNISVFDSIPFEYIEKNIDKKWNWNQLSSRHKDIMKLIYNFPEKINYREASFNENLDLNYVDKFPDKYWAWLAEGMGSSPKINLKFLKKYKGKFSMEEEIDGNFLQQNPNFDISWVYELPEIKWNMKLILENYDLVKKIN